MATKLDIAKRLAGGSASRSPGTRVGAFSPPTTARFATVTAYDPVTNTATVLIDGSDPDDVDSVVTLHTDSPVAVGDRASVMRGAGGFGKLVSLAETQRRLATAKAVADEAQAVAAATGQHFFDDDSGAHVTDVTREEWDEQVASETPFDDESDTKPYHNVLINSLGILLRRALKPLVSITRSAIAFYDGRGTSYDNVTAKFGPDGIEIGRLGTSASITLAGAMDIRSESSTLPMESARTYIKPKALETADAGLGGDRYYDCGFADVVMEDYGAGAYERIRAWQDTTSEYGVTNPLARWRVTAGVSTTSSLDGSHDDLVGWGAVIDESDTDVAKAELYVDGSGVTHFDVAADEMAFSPPIPVASGGTGADTAIVGRANLMDGINNTTSSPSDTAPVVFYRPTALTDGTDPFYTRQWSVVRSAATKGLIGYVDSNVNITQGTTIAANTGVYCRVGLPSGAVPIGVVALATTTADSYLTYTLVHSGSIVYVRVMNRGANSITCGGGGVRVWYVMADRI